MLTCLTVHERVDTHLGSPFPVDAWNLYLLFPLHLYFWQSVTRKQGTNDTWMLKKKKKIISDSGIAFPEFLCPQHAGL